MHDRVSARRISCKRAVRKVCLVHTACAVCKALNKFLLTTKVWDPTVWMVMSLWMDCLGNALRITKYLGPLHVYSSPIRWQGAIFRGRAEGD